MSSKARKSSPSLSAKSGPMRATLPMSSLMRQSSSLRKSKSNSPTLSPTSAWKSTDPSGQRSPGSLNYKAKCKTLSLRSSECFASNNAIRRTASLDTIYLNGQWPRPSVYLYGGLLVDKATQTDENNGKLHLLTDEAKLDKVMRQRRANKERSAVCSQSVQANTCPEHYPSSTGTNTPTSGVKAAPINIPVKPTTEKKMRSSIEGLNQEIEGLVLKNSAIQDKEEEQSSRATPEGHRAPLADLLRSTRSVNTQTPGNRDVASGSTHSSGPPSRGSTPDPDKPGTSPHINKFLAREPPDGCERVTTKFLEDSRRPMIDLTQFEYCPLKPCLTLKPSLGSAFSPLQQAVRCEQTSDETGVTGEIHVPLQARQQV